MRTAQRYAIDIALRGSTVTADDLRELPTGPIRRQFVGAALRALHVAGILRWAGYQPSQVPGNHARPIVAWVLGDRAAAELWLREHPAIDEPPGTQQTLPFTGGEA